MKRSWINKSATIIALLFVLMLTACGRTSLTVEFDKPIATDIAALTESADFVVTGQYVSFDQAWNLARDTQDASQPSKTAYVEGHLCTFHIDSVLKGEIEDRSITVNLVYGEQYELASGDSVFISDPYYTEPDIGANYMLFLTKADHVSYQGYCAASTPWSVRIFEDGSVELEVPVDTVKQSMVSTYRSDKGEVVTVEYVCSDLVTDFLAGKTLDELLQSVKEAVE